MICNHLFPFMFTFDLTPSLPPHYMFTLISYSTFFTSDCIPLKFPFQKRKWNSIPFRMFTWMDDNRKRRKRWWRCFNLCLTSSLLWNSIHPSLISIFFYSTFTSKGFSTFLLFPDQESTSTWKMNRTRLGELYTKIAKRWLLCSWFSDVLSRVPNIHGNNSMELTPVESSLSLYHVVTSSIGNFLLEKVFSRSIMMMMMMLVWFRLQFILWNQ